MRQLDLWVARLVPLAGLAVHITGAVLVARQGGEGPGIWLIAAAWIGFCAYSLMVWMFGDYIQQSLNCKPWGFRDEFQRHSSREAMTVGYFVLLGVAAVMIGMHLDPVIGGEVLSAEETTSRLTTIYLQILTLGYLGVVVPTAWLGWRFQPLAPETGPGTGEGA